METQKVQHWDVYVDGASIAADKKSAIGIALYRPGGQLAEKNGVPLPNYQTSHQAEFQAVTAGMALAKKHKVTHLRVRCDNAVVVGQLQGKFKINVDAVKELHTALLAREKQFTHVEYVAIDREENTVAHGLAQEAIGGEPAKETAALETASPVVPAPKVPLPAKDQHQFWQPVGEELWVWNLTGLWNAATSSPVETVPLTEMEAHLSAVGWFGNEPLTLRRVAELSRQVVCADADKPLLLSAEGDLIDGRFRLAKAICEGRTNIALKRLKKLPAPDGRFPLRYCP